MLVTKWIKSQEGISPHTAYVGHQLNRIAGRYQSTHSLRWSPTESNRRKVSVHTQLTMVTNWIESQEGITHTACDGHQLNRIAGRYQSTHSLRWSPTESNRRKVSVHTHSLCWSPSESNHRKVSVHTHSLCWSPTESNRRKVSHTQFMMVTNWIESQEGISPHTAYDGHQWIELQEGTSPHTHSLIPPFSRHLEEGRSLAMWRNGRLTPGSTWINVQWTGDLLGPSGFPRLSPE